MSMCGWLGAGLLGYLLLMRFEVVPILPGLVHGPMAEGNFRRALLMSRGSFSIFVERPITAAALGVCMILLLGSIRGYLRRRRLADARAPAGAASTGTASHRSYFTGVAEGSGSRTHERSPRDLHRI